MQGMTISEMAAELKLPRDTIKKRLLRAGIKPFSQEAMYTEEDFEAVKVALIGRPKKTAEASRDKPKKKPKKTKK
jgi:hypothetical protein